MYGLTKNQLKMIVSLNIATRNYDFRCEDCNSSCNILSEDVLNGYKQLWGLEAKK